MPVVPYRPNFLPDCETLHHVLVDCQRAALRDNQTKIASLILRIPPMDLLPIFNQTIASDQLYFYYDNPHRAESILAADAVVSHRTEGQDRFQQAQTFVTFWQHHTHSHAASDQPIQGPHFLCSFTFFDTLDAAQSPFAPGCLFIPRWEIIKRSNICSLIVNVAVTPHADVEELMVSSQCTLESLTQLVERMTSERTSPLQRPVLPQTPIASQKLAHWSPGETTFKHTVTQALQAIDDHHLHKVVLAHAVDVQASSPFQIAPSLANLRHLYPDCYVFATSNGRGAHFLGASPERLISIDHGRLTTDALAGSAPRGSTPQDDAHYAQTLLVSLKERYEHRCVVDFIVNQLIGLNLSPQFQATPTVLQLANIQHLHTPIRADLPLTIHALEVLQALHPTPAVAGVPRAAACAHIRQHESFERSLYAAPIGWIDSQGNSEFIVGIRSALLQANQARLYAGAGIVAGSDPNREWVEVRLKLRALLDALV